MGLSTSDQIASVVGAAVALLTAVVTVWVFFQRRRAARRQRELQAAEAFVDELHRPTPEEIAAAQLKALNQTRYYGRPRSTEDLSSRSGVRAGVLVAAGVLVITVLLVVLLAG